METLLQWASRLPPLPQGDKWVFSGAMPTMATLRLGLVVPALTYSGARFAVTNHPHYENAVIRWRTELAYAVCSRKPVEAVWRIYRYALKVGMLGAIRLLILLTSSLTPLYYFQADFIVMERDWCLSPGSKPGCTSVELWDLAR